MNLLEERKTIESSSASDTPFPSFAYDFGKKFKKITHIGIMIDNIFVSTDKNSKFHL